MKKVSLLLVVILLLLPAISGCSQENADNSVKYIKLCYCGNADTAITIDDKAIISDIMSFVSNAKGEKKESTAGHYGVPYSMDIYYTGDKPSFSFRLWSDTLYSTSEHVDPDGYEFFFSADLCAMYEYLQEKYPDEFWYPDNPVQN